MTGVSLFLDNRGGFRNSRVCRFALFARVYLGERGVGDSWCSIECADCPFESWC